MNDVSTLLIGIVGPCSSGKSTLAKRLRVLGYEVREIRQEHSGEPTMWLLRPNWAFAAICLSIIWKTSSFMALILLAGLQMIPKSLYEAAEVDGATKLQQFWQITIPMLMPSIMGGKNRLSSPRTGFSMCHTSAP